MVERLCAYCDRPSIRWDGANLCLRHFNLKREPVVATQAADAGESILARSAVLAIAQGGSPAPLLKG